MSSVHIIVGELSRVEIRQPTHDSRIACFSVADTERWYDANNEEWKEKTQWHDVETVQPDLVDLLQQHGRQGRLVWVRGAVVYSRYRNYGEFHDRVNARTQVGPGGEVRFLDQLDD